MAREKKFLIQVLLFSLPFYALNLLYPKPVLTGLPISFLMISVPFALAGYKIYRQDGKAGVVSWLKESYSYDSSRLLPLFLSLLMIPAQVLLSAWANLDFQVSFGQVIRTTPQEAFTLFLLFYIGASFEELGWTAYLTGPMQEKYGILKTGLIIGSVWGAWHILPYLSQGKTFASIATWVTFAVSERITMGYLYKSSQGSSLTAILFHTMINFFPEILTGGYGTFNETTLLVISILTSLIIVVVSAKNKKEE